MSDLFGGDQSLKDIRAKLDKLQESEPEAPKRDLTKEEKKRLTKLEGLLAKLRGGKNVQNRDLMHWLTEEEYQGFESDWEEQKGMRDYLSVKPDAVIEYEKRLRKASFTFGKAESLSYWKKSGAEKLYDLADLYFEETLEYLHEIVGTNPDLASWFDRPLIFSVESDIAPDECSMPRTVTSRSHERLGNGLIMGGMRKIEVKIQVVERAIEDLKDIEGVED